MGHSVLVVDSFMLLITIIPLVCGGPLDDL